MPAWAGSRYQRGALLAVAARSDDCADFSDDDLGRVFAHAGNAVESIASGHVFVHQLIAQSSKGMLLRNRPRAYSAD